VDEAKARLEAADVGWITTVDRHGQPQSSPVWFLWDGAAIHVLTRPGAAKVRNIAGNPRVTFHLDGAGPGDVVVTIEGSAGTAAQLEDSVADGYVAKYASGMNRLGVTSGEYVAEFSVVLRIVPTRWRVFRSD
jgi:PPOX class probable F420-dependent enzyme